MKLAIGPVVSNGLEFYETPRAHTRWLFSEVDIRGTVLDPCAGSGAIKAAAPVTSDRAWIESDIDVRWQHSMRADATDPVFWREIDGRIDWTVTNTPFTRLIEIASHAIRASRVGVALYARVSINEPLETGQRRTWMHWHPPKGLMFLPRFAYQRSPKTGVYTTDSATACWLVWKRVDPRPQFILYAPERVIVEARDEREIYRARMDDLMGYHGNELERRAQAIAASASRVKPRSRK